jgi:Domain amino terminal to FKBP-type peptidyl-prolyl isomerase
MTASRLFLLLIVAFLLALAHAGTRPEDKAWLEAKGKEDGVVTLPSGLLYKGTSRLMRLSRILWS